ncbi:peptidoglycan editing factor PgeF [Pararhodospirillum oryzae]|uniref:Purine nucleoside phosphorylase n=1 Tax=Pararhodospirillum oryzae TaxID=478448 RepID=A0A512H7M7_9PROT|nr:peptidoglycan editing factor PgeF [Pararhodospirillum oryzae]GEO81463.1 laccase domain protein [Pararhodospirillum oryzae]
MITVSSLNALTNIRHGFFTRSRGVSTGDFASLNCGFGAGDADENVRRNRERALAEIEMPPEALVTVTQRHTDQVVSVTQPWGAEPPPVADALVTATPRLVLGVLTADCAPVLMADPKARVVAAAHAGWRGALGGVLDNTVTAMEALGAHRRDILVGIGPCIAQRSYEVGPEFPAPFLAEDESNQMFFASARREGHYLFDLPGYVAKRLVRVGVTEVMPTPCDTFREESRFFSYRRATHQGRPTYGRLLSVIVLER